MDVWGWMMREKEVLRQLHLPTEPSTHRHTQARTDMHYLGFSEVSLWIPALYQSFKFCLQFHHSALCLCLRSLILDLAFLEIYFHFIHPHFFRQTFRGYACVVFTIRFTTLPYGNFLSHSEVSMLNSLFLLCNSFLIAKCTFVFASFTNVESSGETSSDLFAFILIVAFNAMIFCEQIVDEINILEYHILLSWSSCHPFVSVLNIHLSIKLIVISWVSFCF